MNSNAICSTVQSRTKTKPHKNAKATNSYFCGSSLRTIISITQQGVTPELTFINEDVFVKDAAIMSYEEYINNLRQKILKKTRNVGELGCREWTGGTTGKYGYIRYYNYRAPVSKVVGVHRLQYMIESRNFDLDPKITVSHRCHNTLCVAPEHLSYEPSIINSNREICKDSIPKKCTGHGGYPNCIF